MSGYCVFRATDDDDDDAYACTFVRQQETDAKKKDIVHCYLTGRGLISM